MMGRIAVLGALLVCGGGTLAADVGLRTPTAEEVYGSMTTALGRARTLEASFRVTAGDDTFQGRIVRELGNRLSVEVTLRGENPRVWRMVSDGKTIAHGFAGDMSSQKSPSRLDGAITSILAGSGYVGFVTALINGEITDEKIDQELGDLSPSDLRLASLERVGERSAWKLTMRIRSVHDPEEAPYRVAVWVDRQTRLPLRRRFWLEGEDGGWEETYSDFRLNAPLPSSRFDP